MCGGWSPHSTKTNPFQLLKSGSPPTLPLVVVQRFVHGCGVGADQGGQDGIPAALAEATGAASTAVRISR